MKVLDVLTRVYLQREALDRSIVFYEELFKERCRLRFSHSAAHLELAQVGRVLLIAGLPEHLEPFRATRATFLVDDLDAFQRLLERSGAQIISPPKRVPTGRNMRVRNPDGLLVEYVEHDPAIAERSSQ